MGKDSVAGAACETLPAPLRGQPLLLQAPGLPFLPQGCWLQCGPVSPEPRAGGLVLVRWSRGDGAQAPGAPPRGLGWCSPCVGSLGTN